MGEGPRSCTECGAELGVRARFCSECGAPVAATGSDHELLKTVTLLFTDVTGSTALGEQLDPETYRSVMGRYFETARSAVERHGGTVEKFVGDAVLAVFGIPEVREDDALRAVRAAQEMREELVALSRRLEAEIGVRLEVRAGVNTGQVVAGSARAGGSFATGDAVNTAARLEQAAPPGEVLLGGDTYWLVRDAVEVEKVAPVVAKGKSAPVAAYRLLGVLDARLGHRRRFVGALVGRERESRALVDTLDRTVELQRGHLVTVLGAPGIGKTRLVADFVKDIGERAQVVSGRCVAYGQGITYWPVVQLLREALHLQGDESTELTRHAVDLLFEGSSDQRRVGDLLLALLGKDAEPGARDETFWAVQRAVEQLAARRPLVVTVDDLHWAEPTLLQLIEHLRDEVRDLPLLLVCQARPELLDTRPGWGGGSLNSVSFGLEPLTTEQTSRSLGDLLGGRVSPAVAEALTEWAGGNPLFVEEVASHLVDRGLLVRTDDLWSLTGDLAEAEVPPTVAALLAARLDRLPGPERKLAERLSVVGLEVTEGDVLVLADDVEPRDVHELLGSMARRDLLRRRRAEHGDVWAFRHILVRDAAYDALPKAIRAELHERYADHLASTGDGVGSERAAFVAHHLEESLRNRRELGESGPRITALAVRLADELALAGEQARDRLDVPAATRLLRRAADVPDAPFAARRSSILRLLRVLFTTFQVDSSSGVLEELATLVDEQGSTSDAALLDCLRLWQEVNAGASVDPTLLLDAADVVDAHREADDDLSLSLILAARIDAYTTLGLWSGIAALAQDVVAVGGHFEKRSAQVYGIAGCIHGEAPLSGLVHLGALLRDVESRTPVEDMLLLATEVILSAASVDPRTGALVDELWLRHEQTDQQGPLIYASFAQQLMGDGAGAVRSLRRMADRAEAVGDLSHVSTHLALIACWELERGDPDGVAGGLVEKAASVTSLYDAASMGLVAAGRCQLAGEAGDHAAALRFGAEAVTTMRRTDQLWQTADVLRWVALSLRRCGDVDGERERLQQALELYRHKEIVHGTRVVEARLAELDQPR